MDIALESLLDVLPGSILVVDDDGRIAFAERSLQQLSGYTPEDLVGRHVEMLVPPNHRQAHADHRREYLEAPRSRPMGAPLDILLHHRAGHDVPVEVSLSPVEADGHRFIVAAIRDAVERREALLASRRALDRERAASAKLREAAETKNAFIRAVSHELRTPLTVVEGLASTLERRLDELDDEQVRRFAGRLAHNARRLDTLLSDLLDVDRLTRGVIEAIRRPVDVVLLTLEVVQRSAAGAAQIAVEGPETLELEVDPAQVERILENLLANAVKHTPPETPVVVRWEPDAHGGALLCVDDEGPGIPDEQRQTIFEPFTQGAPGTHHAPGTGVGLSLVAQFAQLHGGRAWVEHRDGGGASFRVLFPPADLIDIERDAEISVPDP